MSVMYDTFLLSVLIILSCLENSLACVPTQTLETTTTTTTTLPPYSCLSGWTMFNRDTYYWCMRIYFGSVDGTGAISACQTLNPTATASGFQTVSEINTMMAISRAENAAATKLFIGGYRSGSCLDVGVALSATCTLLTSFVWTDGYTTGTDAFQWTPGQPDNQGQPGSPQMYLDISTVTGLMDDEWGGLYWDGVVCGMIAQRY